jgi:hypothetical protein
MLLILSVMLLMGRMWYLYQSNSQLTALFCNPELYMVIVCS